MSKNGACGVLGSVRIDPEQTRAFSLQARARPGTMPRLMTERKKRAIKTGDKQDWLTTREACQYLGVSARTLQRRIGKGAVSASDVYGAHGLEKRYNRADLDRLQELFPAQAQSQTSDTTRQAASSDLTHLATVDKLRKDASTDLSQVPNFPLWQEHIAQQKRIADAQERTNELKERELALQERRLEWEMSQVDATRSRRAGLIAGVIRLLERLSERK